MIIYLLLFVCGVIYEVSCVCWFFASDNHRPVQGAVCSMIQATVVVTGIEHSIGDWSHAATYVAGYGAGTFFALLWRLHHAKQTPKFCREPGATNMPIKEKRSRRGSSATMLCSTMSEIERSYGRAQQLALDTVEAEARKILVRYPQLNEFIKAMGRCFFTVKDGRKRRGAEYHAGGGHDIIDDCHDEPRFAGVFDILGEWDEYLKLTGDPVRFTATGERVTDW